MKYLMVATFALMMTACQFARGAGSSTSMPAYCMLRTVSASSKAVRIDVFLETSLPHGMYLMHPACPEFTIGIGNIGAGAGRVGDFLDEVLRQASGGYVRYRIDAVGVYVVNSTKDGKRRSFRLTDIVSYKLVEGGGRIKPIRTQTDKE